MQSRFTLKTIALLLFLLLFNDLILAQDYYNSINPSASSFITDLENRIRVPYTKVNYDNFDETNIANFASINNGNGTRSVFCVYSNYEHIYSGTFSWLPMSREHTYCHSWQPGYPSTSLNEYSDQYHLFPTHQDNANGVRSNHPLGEVVNVISTFLEGKFGTDINGNQVYEPRDEHKGDAARALLYMPVRYNGINGYDWTFNWLNNTRLPSLGEADQDLATLIQWHKQDPPDKWEVDRNNYIQLIQQNRNPFVDHPEYVNYINFNDLTKYNPVYAVEPTNYVTNFSAASTSSSIIFNWNDAVAGTQIPSDYLLVIYDKNSYFLPIDGEVYTTDSNISDGKAVINVSYSGVDSYELTGLSNNKTYYGTIFSYNGSGTQTNFKINETLPIASVLFNGSAILEPTNYATNFSSGTISSSSIQCTWIDALPGSQVPSGYLLLANTTGIINSPIDGIVYSDDTNLADGSATVNISYAGADSYSFNSLNPTTNYYFKIFSYNGTGSQINYKIDGTAPTFNAPTSSVGGGGTLTDLFISEYVEGTSNNKALEIYNGTSSVINLTSNGYKLEFYFNGATTASTTINLNGTINPGNVFVVASSLASSTILNVANQTSSSSFYNGNDAVVLKKGSAIIDVIGQVGFNPGTEWGAGLISTADNTLRRLETTMQGDTNPNDIFNPSIDWTGYATDSFDDLGTFTGISNQTFQFSELIANGWNLISIPGLLPTNQNIDSWWIDRNPSSSVYQFNNGYQSIAILEPGIGYWLNNLGETFYNTGDEWPVSGVFSVSDSSKTFNSGWNIIGCYDYEFLADSFKTNPPGLINSSIFRYVPGGGYGAATNILPGSGYWIHLTGGGKIIYPNRPTLLKTPVKNIIDKNLAKIIISDAVGNHYTLYASSANSGLDNFSLLPPKPPVGIFDIRYSTDRMLEDISSEKTVDISGAVYPIFIRTEGITLNIKDAVNGKIINTFINDGQQLVIENISMTKLIVSGSEYLPVEYSLEQNYPNPFNPTTTIRFAIPEANVVSLKVFNTIGEEIATLVNEKKEAGSYSINFNSSNLASGIYLYKLQAGDLIQTKKMILMK